MMNKTIKKILIINAFVYIFFNFAHPITPQMLQEKNVVDSFNGIAYSIMSLGMVFGSIFWGKQLLKYGSKKIMFIALVGYGLAQILFGFSPSVIGMAIARFLGGSFAASWTIATFEYVNQNSDSKNKTKYFAYMMVTNAIGGIVGQMFAGFLGTKIWIYYMFIFQLIFLVVIGFIMNVILEDFVIKKQGKNKKIKLKWDFRITSLIFIMIFMSFSYTIYTSQIGYYVSEQLEASTLLVGEINSYTSFIMLIVNIYLVGKFTKHLKAKNVIIIQTLVAVLGSILIINSNIFILFSITLLLLGITGYRPVTQKMALEDKTQNSLVVISHLNSANSMGMVLGSFLGGLIYTVNPRFLMYTLLIFLILSSVISIVNAIKE